MSRFTLSLTILFSSVLVLAACRTKEQAAPPAEAPSPLFPVSQGGVWGFIDSTGSVTIEPQFARAWPFSEGRALVKVGERYGFIDRSGALAVPARYTDAWFFSNGLAPVESDGEWVYIDRDGNVAVRPNFKLEASFLEEDGEPRPELGRVRVGTTYGYVNSAGDVVIEPQYNQAWNFVEGMARVKIGGKWGYIDPAGRLAIEPAFDLAWDFSNGLALVAVDGKYGYVDKSGQYVWEPTR